MISLDRIFERDPNARGNAQLAELHASLETIRIETVLPRHVKRLLETAKNLSLYAFFVREFHQVARLMGSIALEVALKEKWQRVYKQPPDKEHQTLKPLLSHALEQRWIESRSFAWVQYAAGVNAKAKALNALFQQHPQGGFEAPTITDADIEREIELASPFAAEWAERVGELRNAHAHGEVTALHEDLHGKHESDFVLRNIVHGINGLFAT